MRFDDRAADRQPHPQTAGLGRVERLKDALEARRRQPRARIADRDEHAVRVGLAVLISNSRDLSATSLMASMAFMIRLRITCCN